MDAGEACRDSPWSLAVFNVWILLPWEVEP